MIINRILAATAILFGIGATPLTAQAANGTVELTVQSFQEVTVKDKTGKVTKKQVPVARVVPGDEVIYVIAYKNNGKQPADAVVITNPVPVPVEFRPGTAAVKGAVDVVSIDGGKNYGKLDKLTVANPDGTTRAATGADVTHVQWKLEASVKPAAGGSVSYRVLVE